MPNQKLGRIAPAISPHLDRRFLKLAPYLKVTLEIAPPSVNWWKSSFPLAMNLNNTLGCCVPASFDKNIKVTSGNTRSAPVVVPDSTTLSVYSAISGYNPADANPVTGENPTDTGCVLSDALAWWKKNPIDGNSISGFVSIDPSNINNIRWAIDIFGSVIFGFDCPQSALDQNDKGQPWSYVLGSPIVGGHATAVYGYTDDADNMFELETWATIQIMQKSFYEHFIAKGGEAWTVINPLWFDQMSGLTPEKLNLASLMTDINLL